METLEGYLIGNYLRDKKDIHDIDGLMEDVGRTLTTHFDPALAWPYQVDETGEKYPPALSQSTTAMILLALLRLLGRAHWNRRWPKGKVREFQIPDLSSKLTTAIEQQSTDALSLLSTPSNPVHGQTQPLSESGTWGSNDPLTAAWLMEISESDWGAVAPQALQSLEAKIKAVFKWPPTADTRKDGSWILPPKTEVMDHAFFDLRFLYLADS